jgi:MYXO-CTERM domain-containing protein
MLFVDDMKTPGLGFVGAVALQLASRNAEACGSMPPAYWTVSAIGSLKDVPTDGAIFIRGKAWASAGDRTNFTNSLRVVVRDAAGIPVPGVLETWYEAAEPTATWHPAQLLAPGATYDVEASATSQIERPADVTGSAQLKINFQTVAAESPPLEVSGAVQVALETYDLPLLKDCNDCGTGCTTDGSVRALRARIRVPAASGGFAPDGYAAVVWLTDDHPFAFPDGTGPGQVRIGGREKLLTGQTAEVLRDVPEENQAYAPCIAVRVLDPAGHFVDTSPVCLPSLDVKATIAKMDTAPLADAGVDAPSVAAKDDNSGCSVAPTSRTSGGLVLLGLAAFIRRLRR